MATTTIRKKKKCVKGFECGYSCIKQGLKCSEAKQAEAKEYLESLTENIEGFKIEGTVSPEVTPVSKKTLYLQDHQDFGDFIEYPTLRPVWDDKEAGTYKYEIVRNPDAVEAILEVNKRDPKKYQNFNAVVVKSDDDELDAIAFFGKETDKAIPQKLGVKSFRDLSPSSRSVVVNPEKVRDSLISTFKTLDKKFNHDGLVPIWQLRDGMSNLGTEEFNDLLLDMQADGDIYLLNGEARGATAEQKEKSLTTAIRGLLFFASLR